MIKYVLSRNDEVGYFSEIIDGFPSYVKEMHNAEIFDSEKNALKVRSKFRCYEKYFELMKIEINYEILETIKEI